MKKQFLLSMICCQFLLTANAQYIVTKVNGRVKKANGGFVTPGSSLTDNDQLTWSSAKDNIFAIAVGKGEKVISPSPAATSAGVITQQVMASLRQSSKSASLSGRGEIIEKLPAALRTNPNSNGKLIIEDINKFLFDSATYPQTGGGVFFAEIDAPGQNQIIRKLQTNNDTLYIKYSDLITEAGGPQIKYALGYRSQSGASQLVANFTPYFDLTNDLAGFIGNTVTAYKGTAMARDAVRDSVYQNVYAASGKPNGILFTELFNRYYTGQVLPPLPNQSATGAAFDEAAFLRVPKLSGSVSVTRAELPSRITLRGYAPPVGYQGSYQTCAAWASAYAARTITYAVQHNYSLNNHYDLIKANTFAPDFVYNNVQPSGNCNVPTVLANSLSVMAQKGNLTKGDNTFNCGASYDNSIIGSAQGYKIKDYQRVNDPGMAHAELIQKVKGLLASKHPLPFGMYFTEDWYKIDASGIWYTSDEDRSKLAQARAKTIGWSGHAMCLIGYDDDVNGGSFEIMNSWSAAYGNKGFYWINYNDFCDFVSDVYAINDYEPTPAVIAAAQQNTPVVNVPKAAPVVIKPVVIPPATLTLAPQTEEVIVKPALKGDMEFMLLHGDNSEESIPVTKNSVGSRGQFIASDADPASYPNYSLAKSFYSGDKYKIRFSLGQPAYVYVLGMDKESNYNLFPQKKQNESAWININNATLYLPNDSTHYTLDNTAGKEKMCVLVSKSPIDIDALNQKFNAGDHNLYQAIRNFLPDRLKEIKTGNYRSSRISFDTPVDDDDVLAFFIEIDHKDKP